MGLASVAAALVVVLAGGVHGRKETKLITHASRGVVRCLKQTPRASNSPACTVVPEHEGHWPELQSGSWAARFGYSPDTSHASHFGELTIETSANLDDSTQLYAAGYAEGFATAERIYQAHLNTLCQLDCSGNIPETLRSFVGENFRWLTQQVASNPADPTWQAVGAIYAQYQGLMAGYRASDFGCSHPLEDDMYFWVLNSLGDMFEILPALDSFKRPDYAAMKPEEIEASLIERGHCSALIKVADDLSSLWAGHSSWFVYSSMLRIYKHYHFPLHNERLAAERTSFSSYPGMLSSLDDFYMMSSGLAMLQTTNGVINTTLYDEIQPEALLAWFRVRTANLLASNGQEWRDIIDFHNSGTYNNQYMVVNFGGFVPGQALPDDLLWVIEQSIGLVEGADFTEVLRRGYFASYNVPALPDIYKLQGYDALDALKGQTLGSSYELAPRAKIFRRDQGNVRSLEDFQAILRYNDYKNDPYSGGSPSGAICSRGDLAGTSSSAGGCYDSKMTSDQLFAANLTAWAINGPTNEPEGAFCWSSSNYNETDSHAGMPDCFDFDWELFSAIFAG